MRQSFTYGDIADLMVGFGYSRDRDAAVATLAGILGVGVQENLDSPLDLMAGETIEILLQASPKERLAGNATMQSIRRRA